MEKLVDSGKLLFYSNVDDSQQSALVGKIAGFFAAGVEGKLFVVVKIACKLGIFLRTPRVT